MLVFADVEANGLKPTQMHCVCLEERDTGNKHTFTDMGEFEQYVKDTKPTWVFHNGLAYDVDAINRLTKVSINPHKVLDTYVVSKLMNYTRFRTHSLKELGEHLGVYKGDYTGGWDVCTPEMVEYCEQDVQVLKAIFKMYEKDIFNPDYKSALRLEHDFAILCQQMHEDGFPFAVDDARLLLDGVKEEMDVLETEFQKLLGQRRVEKKRVKLRVKDDGELYATSVKALMEEDYEIDGEEIVVYGREDFNPGSTKQRIDALWDYGWNPVDKTDGYKKHLRGKR